MHALLGLEVQSKVSGQAGKIRLPAPPARFAHNGLAGGSKSFQPHHALRFEPSVSGDRQLARNWRVSCGHSVSAAAELVVAGGFGPFSLWAQQTRSWRGHPRCRAPVGPDQSTDRASRLAGPFGGRIAQTGNADAAWQSSFNGSLHEFRCEERERDRHVDLSNAAVLARSDAFALWTLHRPRVH